jgi:hypothetical protein
MLIDKNSNGINFILRIHFDVDHKHLVYSIIDYTL